MRLWQSLLTTFNPTVINPLAVDFDGTNDYLNTGADLTGDADGTQFTFSAFIYANTWPGSTEIIYQAGTSTAIGYTISINSSGKLVITGSSSTPTVLLSATSNFIISVKTWTHVLISVNLTSTSNRSMYFNDVVDSSVTWTTYTSGTVKQTRASHGVAAISDGTSKTTGRLANLYLDYTYRDFSIINNRRLFINSTLYPAVIIVSTAGDPNFNSVKLLMLGNTLTDTIGHALTSTGSPSVSTTTVHSPATKSISLSNTNYLTTTSSSTDFDLSTANWTLEWWANTTTTADNSRFIVFQTSSSQQYGAYFASNSLEVGLFGNGAAISSLTITANTWNHYAIVRQSSGEITLYFNGTSGQSIVGGSNSGIFSLSSGAMSIRFANDFSVSGAANSIFFTDIRFTASIARYTANFTPPASNLPTGGQTNPILYLPLSTGSTANINSGTGGNFTQVGTPVTSGRGPNQYNTKMGTFSSGSCISVTTSGYTSTKTGTIIASFRLNALPAGNGFIYMLRDGSSNFYFRLYITSAGVLTLSGLNSSATQILLATWTGTVIANRNYIVAISFDLTSSAKRSFYVNGVSGAIWTTYTNDTVAYATATKGAVGASDDNSNGINGQIGDIYHNVNYYDLTIASNRAKVFTSTSINCMTVDMGVTGTTLTGSSPIAFFRNDATTFNINSGTGGNWSFNSTNPAGTRGINEYWGNWATSFSDSNYLSRAALTETNNSKTFVISGWAQFTSLNLSGNTIFEISNATPLIRFSFFQLAGTWVIHGSNSTGTLIFSATGGTVLANTKYYFQLSIDLSNTSNRNFYVNGTVVTLTYATYTNDLINFSAANVFIGKSNTASGLSATGQIGELYFDTNYIDFSQATNRLKFYDKFSEPVSLGVTGSVPTDNSPILYLRFDPANVNINSSDTGGNFITTGTLTDGGQF